MQHSIENPATGLNQLLAEHRALDARVNELERRLHLTADEEREMHTLKKKKLATKDQILGMQARGQA
jgi:uncharacterized protein YdcH (DUF465 family)